MKTLKMKMEKWNKMWSTDEYARIILNFFNNPNVPRLIMITSAAGQLMPVTEFPNNLKTKSSYFIRKKKEVVTRDNIREVLLIGDMSPKPVEEIAVLVEEVFLPVLSNPANQTKWPAVIAADITKHVYAFRNKVYQIKGALKSQTLLPMPTGVERIYEATLLLQQSHGKEVDLSLKTAIEGAVLQWASLCNDVLQQTSDAAFAHGQNPIPSAEINFWNSRLKNLESIFDQLRDPRVKRMVLYLELAGSSYLSCFKCVFQDVVAGVIEAKNICLYLKPMKTHFEKFEDGEFLESEPYIRPMVHCLGLLWANSCYYCTNTKITTLLKEVANLFISAITAQLDPSTIFQGEPEDMVKKINTCLRLINIFRISFEEVRANLASYFKTPDIQPKPWTFHQRTVFQRLMDFVERLELVKSILLAAIEYQKLERIEIGGIKGRLLSKRCEDLLEEFNYAYANFVTIQYDLLDPLHMAIVAENEQFLIKCNDMDSRLASIFEQVLDDCHNLESIFKFVNIANTLVERPIIYNAIKDKFYKIIEIFNRELDTVKEVYDEGKREGVPINNYFPPTAGVLCWLHKLRQRIVKQGEDFKMFQNKLVESPDALEAFSKWEEMQHILDAEEARVLSLWSQSIPSQITASLSKMQLFKSGEQISVNFDKELEAILREVKYMKLLGIENIPEVALALYERNEELFISMQHLNNISEWYNHLKNKSLPVEYELIRSEVEELDLRLDELIYQLNWTTDNFELIKTIYDALKQLYDRVMEAQRNVNNIIAEINLWGEEPLFERKDRNSHCLLYVEDRVERVHKRYSQITATSLSIEKVMELNYKLFFNIPDPPPDPVEEPKVEEPPPEPVKDKKEKDKGKKAADKGKKQKTEEEEKPVEEPPVDEQALRRLNLWEPYEAFIDELVSQSLRQAVSVSLELLVKATESNPNLYPLFELLLKLIDTNVVFIPSIDLEDTDNFLSFVESLIEDMRKMGIFMKRVKKNADPDYFNDVCEDPEITSMMEIVVSRVTQAMELAMEYTTVFDDFSNLWLDNRQEFLRQFLLYGRPLTAEELDIEQDETSGGLKSTPPIVSQFKEQIDFFEEMYKTVEQLETEKIILGWLRIDARPIRQAILNTVGKWGNMFKQHLYDHVINSISELENFIQEAIAGMQVQLTEDDYEGLLKVMAFLVKIRDMQAATDVMFGPLKDIIALLKDYGVEFSEETYVQLQELPDKWLTCKKVAVQTKQAVGPLQTIQIAAIRRRIALFDVRQAMSRDAFRKMPFFLWGCQHVYALFDKVHKELSDFEVELKKLSEQSNLFDLQMSEYKSLKVTRKELKQIKQLWDFVNIVMSSINEWKTTPWKKIDVEGMEMELKKFGKETRLMDKEVRGWNVYIEMEATIKNMLTSLRAVTELQNPAIRDRHWIQLMQATKVKFVLDDETTLSDLLDLNLHEYEEEVKTIVDKSVKEMAMEKSLKEFNQNWNVLEFDTEIHDRSKIRLLKIAEETIEILEDNQVQLQNMMTSKFIQFFQKEVLEWQQKLSNADQVIQVFFEVQRKWCYLESIFIGSEDIRAQLPEDSKRFDKIDREFKEILNEMVRTLNIVRATSKPGLATRLERILDDLLLCEKALNNYLETKRLAFPRFYFVSSADLLDILSTGNQPPLVARHLTKLFDSLAKLRFAMEGGKESKRSNAMGSKENDEWVPFLNHCDCSGKVEVWLNRVIDIMRVTLHRSFSEAVTSYDEKPRELWIFDYPAQPALCGTQIWWTTEVNIAFARLEEGYENALKDYQKKQIAQLNALITLLLGDLTVGERQKIMTICTIDVHSRDVVAKMIQVKVENSQAFQWQSQLRHRWDTKVNNCFANICDAQFLYQYEYLGNSPRLVITPLTDRCYITLTQSLHLIMGGAPAGPAGTGKTETTKDLGKALGMMVYVFNCSEQMDYKSVGNIYKGLAQTGTWGCFDEFNRISVEVLSVVAVQVKTIQDAVKVKKARFNFLGEEISLIPTIGIFITMNPGYAGRTELPENLKALFRPCAMVVPDFALICEIMLVAEGFQEARLLARKFITLYTLCKELLSKQDHYDWGLRAIKSVLVVAGALRRGDRLRPEDQVLMRALRDFNIPKIVTDDVPVFMGLIGDLFPALDVPRKRSLEFEKLAKASAVDLKLQPEDGFILKVVQLEELFAVRHSVFVLGFAGTGKTCVWKTLNRTYYNQKLKPYYNDLNPKAVTNDELFGIINPATREWKDGLFSVIMRDQANMSGDGPKWIVLDGDIDPMWIESLNTLMDDNKVLTLASNERIALTRAMRLLFEIANLRTATPATVSRAGILYINPADLGWNPYIASWIDTRNENEKANLMILFDKYIPPCLEMVKTKLKKITPIVDIAHIHMLCFLLDCFLTYQNVPPECPKEWYEIYFVFALIWAFGSALFQDQIIDWRNEFSKWFTNEFKTVKFPTAGTVFHYYIDQETKKFMPWSDLTPSFELDPDIPLQATLVNTAETVRVRYFMDKLIAHKHPVMLIGGAGSGKTVLVSDKLSSLSEGYAVTNVPFNFYTTSEMLQRVLENPLEKKAGRVYGPPGTKTMIYFIDDMNMPEVDKYFTVQPHTLLRQWMDYQHWYDRQKLSLKDIHNIQFISCMNPTAGSFTIDPRLQRHFCVFAISFPTQDACYHIYSNIFSQHLTNPLNKFPYSLHSLSVNVVTAALTLHSRVAQTFLPTAVKFHYVFNLRDLSNLFQGMLFANGDTAPNQSALIRLWMHESYRVYGDKLVERRDQDTFSKLVVEVLKKGFEELEEVEVMAKPLIFCHFADGLGDPKYLPIQNYTVLTRLLNEALAGYNDLVSAMNLVLFEDAMNHICRINRIMEAPRGNALLVGVGGSGKQSLTRLAAFISSLEVFQVQLKKGFNMSDLKANIAALYVKAGLKNISTVFLMTDAQVAEEAWLVVINDMLASGEIPDLLQDEEVENILNVVRGEVKASGVDDTKENCWKFYIQRCRKLLKVVLCFSPVGSTLRIRGRKFPAVVSCTAIDWFHEWPKEALQSVSQKFLQDIEVLPKRIVDSVSNFMSYVHSVVNDMSVVYLQNEKRYNYTTPKTFLEQISLYSKLLTEKINFLEYSIIRLENGLLKLASTAEEVDGLKEVLAVQEVVLAEKNAAADKLIVVLGTENEKVETEKKIATEEEEKVKIIEEDVSVKAKICAADLAKAEPALLAAQEALNTLNKNNLTELKSFGTPPPAVVNVTAAVLVLFSKGKIPKDRSWKECKMMMGKADQFLNDLIYYDKEHMSPEVVKVTQEYLKDPEFLPEIILGKSAAAAGLCSWVINILKFYDVFVVVEPKRRALNKANQDLEEARAKLVALNKKLDEFEQTLSVLRNDFEEATDAKLKCQAEADATALMIDLANRLVNGLASEKVRWIASVANYKAAGVTMPGDVLLVTAFISYVGCFTRRYRLEMMNRYWLPFLQKLDVPIPMTEGLDPLSLLTDDARIAKWNNEGLPNDRMSSENATILENSARWPLMIDPQLQGIKWIKNKYGSQLTVIRLSMKNYLDTIERCISNGQVILLENVGETIDAVLDPILGRILIKKGKAIKIGDKDVDYDPRFRLIIHTKLANPHYKPEIQAQTTLINFTVTRDGLEEQLLAEVVKAERPDLEHLKSNLTKQQNDFKITLKTCEDNLLERLSSATGNILGDVALVENLEKTKKTAADIQIKVAEAKVTSIKIDEAREQYRPAAIRGSLLYFILTDLNRINAIYQFSLKAFTVVFLNALVRADPAEKLTQRVLNLLDSISFMVFMYTSRGLFECDKLIFLAQMTFQILLRENDILPSELDFLLRFPALTVHSPFDFLSNLCWGGIKALSGLDEFKNLDKDIEGSINRWRKFVESECPEKEKFPGEWKNKSALQRLCMMRALRPDRMTYAVSAFVDEKLGNKYIVARSVPFAKSYEETSSATPTFFILSPGVNPLKDVEALGKQLGFTFDNGNFHSVSLGQGQEIVAESAIDIATENGHWVILQNIHLVARWLSSLEKKIEQTMDSSSPDYRLYLSAEPNSDPQICVIPQGILESSIKITNEPPTGMFANLHKALDNFNQETLEMCTKEAEFKAILFSLCYFHAVVAERRKFGPQGWNRNYPFNVGDLTISVNVLYNYLEGNTKVPWDDLRYLFGEIMYGGHITDDWDRRLCRTYLIEFMQSELLDAELEFAPGFLAPPNTDYVGYHRYIDDRLPPESPYLYGLHPNAEIGFLTNLSDNLFKTIFELQPRDTGSSSGIGISREDKVRCIIEDIIDKLPEEFRIVEMMAKVEDRTPFIIVAFQECERMNMLTKEMRRSLKELELGLKGELTITSVMEVLEESLFMDYVPESWAVKAYPSMLPLGQWVGDLSIRIKELEGWVGDFQMPPAVWLGGFFNPQSFLTAIMQQTARKNEWPLDKMCLLTDVTKKQREDLTTTPREGANVCGLYMEGARWDTASGSIADSKLKDLFPVVPVIYIKAITQDKQDLKNMYDCPVYKTRSRGPTFVWTFNLKTKEKATKWTLAGVALLLQV
ncbi:dynein beta chain, ciliary-like [Photinus pyralis]|nr:dynein beta chain, ciliary-like [Photinus pyralis]